MTDQQQQQTLYDVKEGDEVIYTRTSADTSVVLSVYRTTPTQIFTSGERFRKSDGEPVGGRDLCNSSFISVATEEKKARVVHDMKYALTKRQIYSYCNSILHLPLMSPRLADVMTVQKVKKVRDSVTLEQLEHALELLEKAHAALSIDPTTTQEEKDSNRLGFSDVFLVGDPPKPFRYWDEYLCNVESTGFLHGVEIKAKECSDAPHNHFTNSKQEES